MGIILEFQKGGITKPQISLLIAPIATGSLTALNSLDLSYNKIDTAGAMGIASGNLTALISLNLERNDIDDAGVRAIADGNFTALTSLNLKANRIGEQGKEALRKNKSIINLTL